MNHRKDPLRAAAQLISVLPRIAASVSEAAVVTCGRVDAYPGGTNVVPGLVRMTLDFRDPDRANLDMLNGRLVDAARSAASMHGVTLEWHPETQIAPVSLDVRIRSAIEANAKHRGLSTMSMPSGAGHDSQNMAAIAPTGMIFIPSKDGRSHSPAEDTDWNDVENGANVLLTTLVELATTGIAS
jgi:N-carbamoyl-L-amino-acid hydrolase